MKKFLCIFLFFIVLSDTSTARITTGYDLKMACKSPYLFNQGECVGYMESTITQFLLLLEGTHPKMAKCVENIKFPQAGVIADVILDYMKKYPKMESMSAVTVIIHGYFLSYPLKC